MFTNFNIGAWTDDSVIRHWSLAYTDFYIKPYNNTPIDKLIIYLSIYLTLLLTCIILKPR